MFEKARWIPDQVRNDKQKMQLFSGTSNQPLAQAIAHELGIQLGDVEVTRFIDNECRVFIKDDVREEEVFVLQSLSEVADQNLVELCLFGQALKDIGAKKVTAIIPWMGYSKQDKAFRRGEAVSMQLVAKFIEAAGFDAVITCELHSQNVCEFFHIPIVEVSTHTLLAATLQTHLRFSFEHVVVVSPDKGGVSRSERFAKELELVPVYLEKTRNLETGEVIVSDIDGSVEGKTVVIFDDIINTGETAVKTSSFVKSKGATEVFFLATHAVLAGNAAQVLGKSDIDKIIVTDTIDIQTSKRFDQLTVIPIAHELASQITHQTH